MKWEYLKDKIYYWDGSWLDIYVLNIKEQNWLDWINFVNETYKIVWFNHRKQEYENQIDPSVVQDYWNGDSEYNSTATFFLTSSIKIKAHFFNNSEFENDIDPRDFQNVQDHEELIRYLKSVSMLMKKEVLLTPENFPKIPLIRVNGKDFEILADRP